MARVIGAGTGKWFGCPAIGPSMAIIGSTAITGAGNIGIIIMMTAFVRTCGSSATKLTAI